MDTREKRPQRKAAPSARSGAAVKRRQRRPAAETARPTDPQIVYTQPKPFNRNRFLLRLVTVVAVVLALILGMAIFFKVENVTVSGMDKYTAWEIREASGILDGENLLTVSEAKISGRIRTLLPYVDSVRVGIKLPDTVNIEIVELDVVYAIESADGQWWLMDANGKIVEKTDSSAAKGYTRILGVQLEAPSVGQQAVAAEETPSATDETGQTVPVTIRGSQRLSAVVTILQYLEDFGVIGQAASVDVSDMSKIELWYGSSYQVNLGDTTQLGRKIESMKLAIDQEKTFQSGILDVSFTTWPDQVGYSPFS